MSLGYADELKIRDDERSSIARLTAREKCDRVEAFVVRINAGLAALGSPAEIAVFARADKSDPLNGDLIVAVKARSAMPY